MTKKLSEQHLEDLRASGLNDDTITASGLYSASADRIAKLLDLPLKCGGLVIPYGRRNGQEYVRVKPNAPYQPPGWDKPSKYLARRRSKNALYIPRLLEEEILSSPTRELWITEGEKKALKAVQEGFPCIALSGVWNWAEGKDRETGQRHVIPDLQGLTLENRRVYVCFDADAATNPNVQRAEEELAGYLSQRGASVYVVRLPECDGVEKTGLDDFLIHKGPDALRTLMAEAAPFETPLDYGPYEVRDGKVGYVKATGKGDKAVLTFIQLANLQARVIEDISHDNGVERTKVFAVTGELESGKPLPRAEVQARHFQSMSWVMDAWGVKARISAGFGAKDKLREAIQCMSHDVIERTVYTHTGWRKGTKGWIYLHAGGAIGEDRVEVSLDRPLDNYRLPDSVEDLRGAVEQSLSLLEVAPTGVTIPLLSATALGPLSSILKPDFALWLFGTTGSLKSTLSALFLSHYGNFRDKNSLPASWESTENALEKRLFTLKDVPCVIDDYAPKTDASSQARMERICQRVIRSQGNLSARGRMRPDTTLRPDYPPRGLLISTGEDIPTTESILARTLTIEVDRAELDLAAISRAQETTERLPHAMRGYIEWIAGRYDELRKELRRRCDELRTEATQESQHLRIPEVVAYLATGFDTYLRFAVGSKAISESQADRMFSDAWTTLFRAATAHAGRVRESDPAERFLSVLASLLAQDSVRVLNKHQSYSDGREEIIGWYDEDFYYFLPTPTRAAVVKKLRDGGEYFAPTPNALYRALRKCGALVPGQDGRNQNNVRLGGRTRRVVQVLRSSVEP